MASMGGGHLDLNPEPIVRMLKAPGGMVNRQLQAILVAEGLPKAGVKTELQQRLIDRIQDHARKQEAARFTRLKNMIENPNNIQNSGAYSQMNGFSNAPSPAMPSPYSVPPPYSNGNYSNNMAGSGHPVRGPGMNFEFKSSPFYHIKEQIGDTKVCDTMAQHRHTVNIQIKPTNHPILSRVLNDPTLRVMIFCSSESHGRQDIAFPHQSEIKINTGEVKANLRGLKNKPGSTRPVDITSALRLKIGHYVNSVEMTYALTTKAGGVGSQKFYMVIYVVQTVPVADLVKKLEEGKRITKDHVIRDMVNKARDTDIVATSTVLSLKCPLSTLRIDLPCRSVSCRHIQCFDATSYLQLQEQGPTWLCPICNNSAPFESLAVDDYVKDILKSTSRSADQVIIEPNGTWKSHEKPKSEPQSNGRQGMSFADDDDDDDLVEVTKTGQAARLDTPLSYRTPNSAPMVHSREQSTLSSGPAAKGSSSGKRPISAVIDLTSSGDEDDEPLARAAKRQFNGYSTPSNALPAYRPGQPTNGYPRP